MVIASQACVLVFSKNIQNAVAPPALSQTVPPEALCEVHGSPRGPNVTGELATLPSETGRALPEGKNSDFRLFVLGALAAAVGATSEEITVNGSLPATAVPPFPEAPVLLCG